jgi:hypothetical protein
MDQISPPMRIALAVAVLFGAVYMLVLKPGGETGSATPAPATASASDSNTASTGLGKAVEGARGAAAATEAKQDAEAAAAGETTSAPSTSSSSSSSSSSTAARPSTTTESAPKPADESLADLPEWLQKSMDKKVVAILFTNGKSADDRRTQKALKHAYKADGKVVARVVPIAQISRYRPVAQGVDVQQSPTLMVIDRARGAQALVGYSSQDTVDQAIIDGLLATDRPVEHVKYLQTVQRECRQITNQAIIGETRGDSVSGARKNVTALIATMSSSLGTVKNAPVPAAYRPLSRHVNSYLASSVAMWKQIKAVALDGRVVDSVKIKSITRNAEAKQHRTLLELNAVGVSSCN